MNHNQIPHVTLLIIIAVLLSCAAAHAQFSNDEAFEPDLTDAQRNGWITFHESIANGRDLRAQPLDEAETELVSALFDIWRDMPSMQWAHGRVVDATTGEAPAEAAYLWIEEPYGDSINYRFRRHRLALSDEGTFNLRVEASAGIRIGADGEAYMLSGPQEVFSWPAAPSLEGDPNELLMDSRITNQINDMVQGRIIEVMPKANRTMLDRRSVELSTAGGRPLNVFVYRWEDHPRAGLASTPLTERRALTSSDLAGARRDDGAFSIRVLDETEQVDPSLMTEGVILIAPIDELGRVRTVQSETHSSTVRDENGIVRIDGEEVTRPRIYPEQIIIRFLGEGDGAIRVIPEPFHISRRDIGIQLHTAPEHGYLSQVTVTSDDLEYATEQATPHYFPWFYVKIGDSYGRLTVIKILSSHPDGIVDRGMNEEFPAELGIRVNFFMQPDGTRNLLTDP